MKDLALAVGLLHEEQYTCVLCKGEEHFVSRQTGISPMLDLIDSGADLNGFSAADKIVGKATALLFVLAGIKAVHAEVLSEAGKEILQKYGIPVSCGTLTQYIINRKGDGMCPMEETVLHTDDPHKALVLLRNKRDSLRSH